MSFTGQRPDGKKRADNGRSRPMPALTTTDPQEIELWLVTP